MQTEVSIIIIHIVLPRIEIRDRKAHNHVHKVLQLLCVHVASETCETQIGTACSWVLCILLPCLISYTHQAQVHIWVYTPHAMLRTGNDCLSWFQVGSRLNHSVMYAITYQALALTFQVSSEMLRVARREATSDTGKRILEIVGCTKMDRLSQQYQ